MPNVNLNARGTQRDHIPPLTLGLTLGWLGFALGWLEFSLGALGC